MILYNVDTQTKLTNIFVLFLMVTSYTNKEHFKRKNLLAFLLLIINDIPEMEILKIGKTES